MLVDNFNNFYQYTVRDFYFVFRRIPTISLHLSAFIFCMLYFKCSFCLFCKNCLYYIHVTQWAGVNSHRWLCSWVFFSSKFTALFFSGWKIRIFCLFYIGVFFLVVFYGKSWSQDPKKEYNGGTYTHTC